MLYIIVYFILPTINHGYFTSKYKYIDRQISACSHAQQFLQPARNLLQRSFGTIWHQRQHTLAPARAGGFCRLSTVADHLINSISSSMEYIGIPRHVTASDQARTHRNELEILRTSCIYRDRSDQHRIDRTTRQYGTARLGSARLGWFRVRALIITLSPISLGRPLSLPAPSVWPVDGEKLTDSDAVAKPKRTHAEKAINLVSATAFSLSPSGRLHSLLCYCAGAQCRSTCRCRCRPRAISIECMSSSGPWLI